MDADKLILDTLEDGPANGAKVADEIDLSRKYVNGRMRQLSDYRLVTSDGYGYYTITERGIATLLLIDEYSPDPSFEERVDERAEYIEIKPFDFVDHFESCDG